MYTGRDRHRYTSTLKYARAWSSNAEDLLHFTQLSWQTGVAILTVRLTVGFIGRLEHFTSVAVDLTHMTVTWIYTMKSGLCKCSRVKNEPLC